MKYTKSLDGKMRANLHATIRLEREEIAELRQLAKEDGYATLGEFLAYCMRAGIWDARERLDPASGHDAAEVE